MKDKQFAESLIIIAIEIDVAVLAGFIMYHFYS